MTTRQTDIKTPHLVPLGSGGASAAHWSPCGRGPFQPVRTAASRLATDTPLLQDLSYWAENIEAIR